MDYIRICEHLLKRYRDRSVELEEMLSNGGAADSTQYSRVVGEISGLRTAQQEIIDLRENMEKAEND